MDNKKNQPVALISVSDKTDLDKIANLLHSIGWHILASGGTSRHLQTHNIPVQEIANYTNSPEILSGRVKTLHPAVHGGILARDTQEDNQDLKSINASPIDLVIVNLYPFEQVIQSDDTSFQEAIENIDIGGVALIRAAAKNHHRVAIVTSPSDYAEVIKQLEDSGEISLALRQKLAVKAFQHTASYDHIIANHLAKSLVEDEKGKDTNDILSGLSFTELRYGENPHQSARYYSYQANQGPIGGELLQGKALSYNNLLDLDAAWRSVISFEKPTVSIIKHLSPCGIASSNTLAEAFPLALECDPVSAYGGIIATNRLFDADIANKLGKLFVECIIAPGFSSEAKEILSKRKNCRLISMPNLDITPYYEIRSVNNGLLWQIRDTGDPADSESKWEVKTEREPTAQEWESLRFAWKACQHIKSNAVLLAQGLATIGIGGGQPNRIDCVQMAITRAKEQAKGSVLASDAFFPFGDSLKIAAEAGITAVIQPGGSIRDSESIEVANANNIAMVFTGTRHFRH